MRPKPRPVRGGTSTIAPPGGRDPLRARMVVGAAERRHRRHGRVAGDRQANQNGKRRIVRSADGPLRRAMRGGHLPARPLQGFEGPREVRGEVRGGPVVGPPVQVPVDADLVPAPDRFGDEVRIPGGDPPQEEEGPAVPPGIQEIEDRPQRRLDPRGKAGPAPRIREVFVPADVKPVLDVDRQHAGGAAGNSKRSHGGGRHERADCSRGGTGPGNEKRESKWGSEKRLCDPTTSQSRTPCSTPPPTK